MNIETVWVGGSPPSDFDSDDEISYLGESRPVASGGETKQNDQPNQDPATVPEKRKYQSQSGREYNIKARKSEAGPSKPDHTASVSQTLSDREVNELLKDEGIIQHK